MNMTNTDKRIIDKYIELMNDLRTLLLDNKKENEHGSNKRSTKLNWLD